MNPMSQIKLEREDKRITLTLPYNLSHIKKIKTIPGYRWHPDKKHWSFPYSEDIFKKILSLKDYLLYLVEKKKAATSTLNVAINALKFYYGTMLKRKFLYEIKRPRKDKKLPVVLSKEEVAKILSSVDNVKHKAILMLIYSAGLRISEAVKLKPEYIDSKRMLIHVKGAKGRKDRYTMLSDRALQTLREYRKEYRLKMVVLRPG